MTGHRISTKDIQSGANVKTGARRSQGQIVIARALWHVKPFVSELRNEKLGALEPGHVRIATLFSAISRGTERIVASGQVPHSEWQRMRAPSQSGEFSFPVKYGYSAVGTVISGPDGLLDKTVFCLHPHQDVFDLGADKVAVVPGDIPADRATLAANMETALNAHWDAATTAGDKVLVVGAGIVGLLVAYLASRIAGVDIALTDVDESRAALAASLGLSFIAPANVRDHYNIAFHTSATAAGLETAINASTFEGRVVELSWYGAEAVPVNFGGAFHSRRLQLVSSQVGHVSPKKRATVTHSQRLALAMTLLNDTRLDQLVKDRVSFADAPTLMPRILRAPDGLPPVITYSTL